MSCSCEIPTGLQQTGAFDSTNGTGGGASVPAVQIVQGNMFGCRGIETLCEVDAYGKAYQCGYSAFLVPFIVSVVTGALVVGIGVWHVFRGRGESSNWRLLWSWVQTREQGLLPRALRGVFLLSGGIVGVGLLVVAAGFPTYGTASSHFECQYANKFSLAFVEKAPESASDTHYPVEWVTTTLLALSIGGMAWIIAKSRPSRLYRKEFVALRFVGIGLPTSPSVPYASETKHTLAAIEENHYKKLESKGDSDREHASVSWQRCRTPQLVARIVLVITALLVLTMSTSIAQVYVDISSQISDSNKNFLIYGITVMHVVLSLTIFPLGAKFVIGDLSEFRSGRREADVSFGVALLWNTVFNSLSNIFAPAISEAFGYDSCLRPLLTSLPSTPEVRVTTDLCMIGFVANGVLSCGQYLTLSTGEYRPHFHLRSDYCTSTLVRVFAPFFTTLVLEMLLAPVLQRFVSFAFSRPNKILLFVFGAKSFAAWPDIARQAGPRKLARAAEDIVKSAYCEQIILVGIILSMGIAAPIVAMAVAFVSVVLALHYAHWMSVIGTVINEREEEIVHAGETECRNQNDSFWHLTFKKAGQKGEEVDGSIPWTSLLVPVTCSLMFWAVFGWAGLNFGWPVAVYLMALLLIITAMSMVRFTFSSSVSRGCQSMHASQPL
eukprot:jgi/Bigna1/82801/fgenesh1_pg.97_\